jgi:2-(1,2-epoxy-1,2-dihydrophenyl)acetyl-CoA isomerase
MSNALLTSRQGAVMTVTMNRPDQLNILGEPGDGDAFRKVFDAINEDRSIKCVIFTGAGRAFSAGGNVKDMRDRENLFAGSQADIADNYRNNVHEIVRSIWHCAVPVIAAVNGPAAGAGMSYALSCDLRIMSDSAFFTTAFAKVGFSGDYGGSYFMTQLVGLSKAKELYFLSDKIPAEEALKLGLTNWVVKHDELEQKTLEIAKQLAEGPAVAFRYMKENLNRAVSGEVDDCLDLEVTHHVHCGQTEDHKNATKAFVEKKQPVFKGR